MSGVRQKEVDMGQFYSRQDEDEADRKFIAEREAKRAVTRGHESDQKPVKPEVMVVCEAVVKILRKIHDPNKLTQFQKDLALVAVGAESLEWLKKEWS